MKKYIIRYKFIAVTLCIFLFQSNLKAQIEPIQVGSTTRNMLVYAPDNIQNSRPLLISMHGLNQDIAYQKGQTQWETVADEENFVVVYPAGINNSWDLGGTRDTDFILAIIDEMYSRYSIDRDRIYLSGFSMGGMMTYHAMNVIADKIAAFAPVSGYLMGGPNTNSSRPVPIIHTHGTGDPVVPYGGVQTCLDAWIKRNACPDVPQVTKPYPVNKPNSNGTKYYWGPGNDNVEIVLLSLAGVGHWHSLDGNGVHTSREIWEFCKKYSLGFGVPKFESASVTDDNPKQINLTLSEAIVDSSLFDGFTVKIDGIQVLVDSVVMIDTNQLSIVVNDSIKKDNDITLSYHDGNVYSTLNKELSAFSELIVDNFRIGSPPRIVSISSTEYGDTLLARFNKKMKQPTEISGLELYAGINGDSIISIVEINFVGEDSTLLSFKLSEKVYADYDLTLSYLGSTFVSTDDGLLKEFTSLPVVNNSNGLPVYLKSSKIAEDASTVTLEFSKPMIVTNSQKEQIVLLINGEKTAYKDFFLLKNTMTFVLSNNLHYNDTLTISYIPGNITSADKGPLVAFSNIEVKNPVAMPTWHKVPGKIQAENYALQFGTDTENTNDAGGGLNVGWIDNGDWMEYAIENTSDDTKFEVTFRLASTSSDGRIDFYLDNKKRSVISVPNTGNWQSWRSVVKDITITKGKHYIKLYASTGGFNVNYMDIKLPKQTGTKDILAEEITIYPNPVSDVLVINTGEIHYNTIDLIDMTGQKIQCWSINGETELRLALKVPNGVYFLKAIGEKQQIVRKIIVDKQ